jgi:hypothetical protein
VAGFFSTICNVHAIAASRSGLIALCAPWPGSIEFPFKEMPHMAADTRALPAASVQLGLGPLRELQHHAFHFHGRHLLC